MTLEQEDASLLFRRCLETRGERTGRLVCASRCHYWETGCTDRLFTFILRKKETCNNTTETPKASVEPALHNLLSHCRASSFGAPDQKRLARWLAVEPSAEELSTQCSRRGPLAPMRAKKPTWRPGWKRLRGLPVARDEDRANRPDQHAETFSSPSPWAHRPTCSTVLLRQRPSLCLVTRTSDKLQPRTAPK